MNGVYGVRGGRIEGEATEAGVVEDRNGVCGTSGDEGALRAPENMD